MCRNLTICCQRIVAKNISISDHYLTLSDLKIPCTEPGTDACRSGEMELKDFQNPPTTCAGAAAGFSPVTEACEAVGHKSLEKYGRSLHRMQMQGLAEKSWWATAVDWLSKAEHGVKESSDRRVFVVSRDTEDRPYKIEESRASMDG